MKRLLVAVLVLAGCGSKTPPQERPLPPGMVTLATFTAEADPVAGTFAIRMEPTAAGRARGVKALLDGEVRVQNAGDPWYSGPSSECPGVPETWGAEVRVTSLVPGDVWLGGVYAEITNFAGGTGNEGCNSSVAPDGLDSQYGLWEYPTIGPGDAGAQVMPWVFVLASTDRFTFTGRIIAAKVGVTEIGLDPPVMGSQVLTVYDQIVAYLTANGDAHGIQYVNFDGSGAGYTSLPAVGTSIAPDLGDGLIWFTTEGTPGMAGYVHGGVVGGVWDALGDLGGIVPDPQVPMRAWYRSNEGASIRWIDATLPVIRPDPISTSPYAPYGMAIGPDLNLYVTAPSDDKIMVFTTGESGGDWLETFDTGPDCAGPTSIIQGPGGVMWFSAEISNVVCSFTSSIDVAPVNTADFPTQLAVGPDGNVWVAADHASQVARMDGSGPGYRINLFNEAGAFGLATGGGKLWAADIYGIYPIELDPLTP